MPGQALGPAVFSEVVVSLRNPRLLLSTSLACCAILTPGCQTQKPVTARSAPPAVPVSLASAKQESVSVDIAVVGTVEASSVVQVRPQVTGELVRVQFTEGSNVPKGALLFEIDSRPYEQALHQAEASLAKNTAQLRQAGAVLARDRAELRNAETEATRSEALLKDRLISKSQHDALVTKADVARESVNASEAAIESARAALQGDRAAIEKAKLDISYCRIHAPVAGRTGNLLVNVGNLVRSNSDAAMVVIHQISPVYVNFNVPEQHLSTVRRMQAQHMLPIRVSAKNDAVARAASGTVRVVENTVDAGTGTIHLKGELANADASFWPGQFVNVVLTLGTTENATVVPAEAVQSNDKGQFVYVVKADKTIEIRPVQAGRSVDRRIIIDKGIAPGDTVVIDGHLRLFPGARIQAVDAQKIEGVPL